MMIVWMKYIFDDYIDEEIGSMDMRSDETIEDFF